MNDPLMTDTETTDTKIPRIRMDVFVGNGKGGTDMSTRYVINREKWMEKQREILPLGTKLTWYRGAGLGTNQYRLDTYGWALLRITYGSIEA